MKRRSLLIGAAVIAAGLLIAILLRPRPEKVDALYVNGNIITMNPRQPSCRALAVRGGRIAGVGEDEEMRRQFTPDTTIDLQGKCVLPGFIDSHAHLEGIGVALMNLAFGGKGKEEILEIVRNAAAGKGEGEWVRGRGWDQNLWHSKAFPTARDLDRVSGNIPVYLVRVDGHAAWVNSTVLKLTGVTRKTPDPQGGRILRDGGGNPTGVFLDNAMDLLAARLPEPSEQERTEALRLGVRECLSRGITGLHDMGAGLAKIRLLKRMAEEGELHFRVYEVLEGTDRDAVEHYLVSGPEIGLYDGRITVRAIKLYADGALGSRGAALIAPYSDDPGNRGLTLTDAGEMEMATRRAIERGFQLCVHAIGDRANSMVLTAFDKGFKSLNVNGKERRFRVEHAQVLDRNDIPRFAAIGVIPSMQPKHCTSDMPWAEERLGPERVKGAYVWRSLIDAGSFIPAGSDAPVEDPSVLAGIYAAVTRQRTDGTPEGGWNPAERMSREEALKAYTIWGAEAGFEEGVRGSIEPGKFADFVVLSGDPLRCDVGKIPLISIELTVVGGRQAYIAERR